MHQVAIIYAEVRNDESKLQASQYIKICPRSSGTNRFANRTGNAARSRNALLFNTFEFISWRRWITCRFAVLLRNSLARNYASVIFALVFRFRVACTFTFIFGYSLSI